MHICRGHGSVVFLVSRRILCISTICDKPTPGTSHACARVTPANMTGRTLTERLYLPV